MTRLERALLALLLLSYLWPVEVVQGPNVMAHMDQAAAIVGWGTLSIDPFKTAQGVPDTIDWARAPDGRFYPAKAPGCALWAVPFLGVLAAGERALGIDPFRGGWLERNAAMVNVAANAVPAALAMVLLLRLCQGLGVPPLASALGVLAIALGTGYHAFATAYYAHVPAAALIVGAAYLLWARRTLPFVLSGARPAGPGGVEGPAGGSRAAAAGAVAGAAVLFEYTAALAVLVFAATLACERRGRALALYGLGGLIPLAVFAAYHEAAFGSPFAASYQFQNPDFSGPGGSFLHAPSLYVFASLLFSRFCGLLFFSPVLVLAAPGAALALRDARTRPLAGAALALLASWLLLNSSYRVWWGGAATGPRLPIPALPLLAPLLALGMRRVPWIGVPLLAISVANYFAVAAVSVIMTEGYRDPLFEAVYPSIWYGVSGRANLGAIFLDLPGIYSLVPLAAGAAVLFARVIAAARAAQAEGLPPDPGKPRSAAPPHPA